MKCRALLLLVMTFTLAIQPPHAAADTTEPVSPFPVLVADFTTATTNSRGLSSFSFEVAAGSYRDADGKILNLPQGATYTCIGRQENPHISVGAGGVISKARLKCSGPVGNIPIRVTSLLGKSPTSNPADLVIRASSSYIQNVFVNAARWSDPWYVPQKPAKGVPKGASGYWRASHVGESVPPMVTFSTAPGRSAMTYLA